MLLAEPLPPAVRELFVTIQHDLFNLGGELAMPAMSCSGRRPPAPGPGPGRPQRHAARLKEFILPAGTLQQRPLPTSATVARRAERSVVTLGAAEDVRPAVRHYLNRLSDLLFVLARVLNRANLDGLGGDDVYWQSERLKRMEADGD